MKDSIEGILDDCTLDPREYCISHDCGQGIYDELADYVPDMCIHLVGRTEAVVRRNLVDGRDSLICAMMLDLIRASNGKAGRKRLNKRIASYADEMEELGVI